MKTISFSDLTLEDLLPHRGRMLLVERVLEVDCNNARTLSRVAESWPMAGEHGVHPLILVELAAQTAGVCNGWDRIRTKGLESDQMGWLVGIKKTEIFVEILPFGGEIITSATNSYSFENLREVSCEQRMGDTIIGTSTLQLFQA
jgi:predicted hotdog family 3-hydroxylacyl-ACP dehydratase